MSSVTGRIKEVKQPQGGYIRPSSMEITTLNDGIVLNEIENIAPSIIGMSVDYLTRLLLGATVLDAFNTSIIGAKMAEVNYGKRTKNEIYGYLKGITGLDDNSIINACKATTFDVRFRNPMDALFAKTAKETNPDKDTIDNIKTLVERSLIFWNQYGPIKVHGFTFEKNGYTKTVDGGDGDYLTEDTIWDLKVSKSAPTSKNTLQLLMYYIMGKHSGKQEFKGINKIGIFNPRLNKVYQYDTEKIPQETIRIVEKEVICY